MLEIINTKSDWDSLLKEVDNYDFYHSYDYHLIAKGEGEKPILIKYTEDDYIIGLPLLIRQIVGTSYFDATSVYGYPGPLTKNITKGFDNTEFRKQLQESFLENNIISVFSRLNPYIPYQEICLQKLGEISTLGNIVNIDLSKDLETQKQVYHKRLKTYINMSQRNCTVIKGNTKEDISAFIDIYHENLKRVKAKKYYFFDRDYFFGLLNSKDFNTELLLALNNGNNEIIGGVLFIKKGHFVQYHLSGAKKEHLNLSPTKLLIDEMRIIATNENYTYFNLGGGFGNKKDNLFKFKSGFSNDFWDFKLWKYIVNEEVYEELVHRKQSDTRTNNYKKYSDYFPFYRCDI